MRVKKISALTVLFALATLYFALPPRPQSAACSAGVCLGDYVIDPENRIGYITALKERKAVYVSNNREHETSVLALSPEMSHHRHYRSDFLYANSQHKVGMPARFFRDGRMQFLSIDGRSYIEKQLYRGVPELRGYRQGTSVKGPSGREKRVTRVFENGTLLCESDSESQHAARIYGLDPSRIEVDREIWSTLKEESRRYQKNLRHREITFDALVIRREEYERLDQNRTMATFRAVTAPVPGSS